MGKKLSQKSIRKVVRKEKTIIEAKLVNEILELPFKRRLKIAWKIIRGSRKEKQLTVTRRKQDVKTGDKRR